MNENNMLQAVASLADRNGRSFSRANSDRAGLYTTADRYTGEDAFTGTLAEVYEWEQGYIYP